MIFFVANDGTIIKSFPSPVYQGAANSNSVYLVAPFAVNTQVTVAFKLPNGMWTSPAVMAPLNTLAGPNGDIINKQTGQKYAGWSYDLPNQITRYYGTVTAQFFFYAAQSGVLTATSATSFVVGKGVPTVLPDTPAEDVYEAILSNLAALQEQLDNGAFTARSIYAYNSAYTYGANEITFTNSNGQYGAFVRSLVSDNTNPPFNALGQLNVGWEVVADFDEIYMWVRYGVAVRNGVLIFSPLDPNVEVQGQKLILKEGF